MKFILSASVYSLIIQVKTLQLMRIYIISDVWVYIILYIYTLRKYIMKYLNYFRQYLFTSKLLSNNVATQVSNQESIIHRTDNMDILNTLKQDNFQLNSQVQTQQKIIDYLVEQQQNHINSSQNILQSLQQLQKQIQLYQFLMIKKQDQISSLEIKQLQLEQEIDDNSLLNISQSLQSKLVQEQDLINIIDRLVVENQSIRNNEFVYNDKIIKDSLLEQLFESDNDVQIAMLQLSDKECQLQSMKKVDQEQTIIIKYLIEQQQTIDDDTSVYLKSQQDKQYAILETKYKNKITKLQNIIIQQQTIQ